METTKTTAGAVRMRIGALALLSAALLMAGCGSDDAVQTDNADRVALRVTSGISTRAANDEWTAGDAIGIYMLSKDGSVDTYANIKYTTQAGGTDGAFSPAEGAETIYLPVDGTVRDFIAYYPYSSSLTTDNTTCTINLSDQTDQEAIDFMAAAVVKDKSRTDNAAPFVFAHKLAKIAVTIKSGDGISDEDLEGMTVSLTGQPLQGTYSVTTDGGTVTPSTTDTGIIGLLTKADGTGAEGIIFPSTNFNGMSLTFKTQDMGDYSWSLSSSSLATKFEAGKRYLYTITVNRTALEVTATITDWVAGNSEGDTGSAE